MVQKEDKSKQSDPPKAAQRFLLWFLKTDLAEEVLGDLEEQYDTDLDNKSPFRAKVNYWYQVGHYLRPFAIKKWQSNHSNHSAMLQNYFKIAWRNLIGNKAYSMLNISGLAVGMACSILILLWVQNELSFDRFHENATEIYRLNSSAGTFKTAVSPAGMAEGLQNELPEIKSTLRLSKPVTALFEVDEQKFEENRVFYADSNFLELFTFPLIKGDAKTALHRPDGLLLTKATAKKYFGNAEALGKSIKIDDSEIFTVTGILADLPANSHLQFDIILPMSKLAKTHPDPINKVWGNFNFYSYLQFYENAISTSSVRTSLEEKIHKIHRAHVDNIEIDFQLQALTDIHLHSDLQIDLPGHGNIQYVNIFFVVACLILIVACINFMNLATARSARRAKEVGLRKVVGARRNQLIGQFLSESLLLSFLSLIIGLGLVKLALPYFNELSGKQLALHFWDAKFLLSLLAIGLITGLIAGSYPALFLSSFKPVRVLKGKMKLGIGNLIFRNGLVITQFAVSALLLVGTAVIYSQLNFIKNKNLGFEKSNLLYIPMTGEIWEKQQALETALEQNPLTSDFSIITELPTNLITGAIDVQWEGKDPNAQVIVPSIRVDENFLDVFQMELLKGRGLSKDHPTDESNYVINEEAVRMMGLEVDSAVGKNLTFNGSEGMIIGVVKDFNFKPLQYAIEPLVLNWNNRGGIVVIRTPPNNTETAIKALKKIYGELNPAYPLAYHFMDKDLDNQYRGEQQMGTIFNLLALLAIFISCLGLYGLSAFMAEQRTKEIGIRKVLGASTLSLMNMLSKDFFKLVLAALLVAFPLSWYFMGRWLQDFAYHIELSGWFFAAAGVGTLFLTLVTVSFQVVKAALGNPVKSLRSE